MANELQIINQPDSVPNGISTGYQQQNVILEAQRNGFDGTAPFVSAATTVTVPIGGPVDVNGVLYSVTIAAVLTISLVSTDYYIHLVGSGTNLTPTLSTNSGTFDATKNARYNASSERILDWVARRDASAAYVYRMEDKQNVDRLDDQGLRTIDAPTFDDLTITDDLTIGDDLTVGDAAGIGGIATIDGAILPTTSPTIGSQAISASSVYVLPRGIWDISLFTAPGTNYVGLEFLSTAWRTVARRTQIAAILDSFGSGIISDGTNVRVNNVSVGAYTFYYQKY